MIPLQQGCDLRLFLLLSYTFSQTTAGPRKLCFVLARHQTVSSGLPTQAESCLAVGCSWIYYLLPKLLRSTERFRPLLRILSQISLVCRLSICTQEYSSLFSPLGKFNSRLLSLMLLGLHYFYKIC